MMRFGAKKEKSPGQELERAMFIGVGSKKRTTSFALKKEKYIYI
jgi:hypothetical protein